MIRARLRTALFLGVLAVLVVVVPAAAPAERAQDYIVVLQDSFSGNAAAVAQEHARTSNGRVGFVFEHALKGFVIRVSPAAAERLAARDHRIAYVEADAPVDAS